MKFLIIVSLLVSVASGARILGVFPYPSHSHQVVFKAITRELATRGHELIVFTTHPDNVKIPNYREVSLESIKKYKERLNFYVTAKEGPWRFLRAVYKFSAEVTDETLSNPVMQELLSPNNTQKFDVILVQALFYDGIYSLAHFFNAPLVGVSSLPIMGIQHYILGNPLEMSYSTDPLLGYTSSENTLWDRMTNIYYVMRQIYEYENVVLPLQEEVLAKHFGDRVPPIREITNSKMSIVLTSAQPYLSVPHPVTTAMVSIGGCRRTVDNTTLPKNIQEICDKAKHGVIYFSLGSNLQSRHLPVQLRNTFLEVFAELPYTVLWKYENNDMTGELPKNVFTQKWLPQMGVLAHPKTVLFIYQGGLQSTEEAMSVGLPLIGFPMFSDQVANIMRLHEFGVAKRLSLTTLTKEKLKSTILEMIRNPSYKENAMKLRGLIHERLVHPMDNAIWWIEHVIKHKGADHIRSKARDMPLYQLFLLDIIGIAFVTLAVIMYSVFLLVRLIMRARKHGILNFNRNATEAKKHQ